MPTSQNGQTHSNNLMVVDNKLFDCVWSFCGVGAHNIAKLGKCGFE